ncbi:transcription factor protein [Thecamonas trahens ATCC 50062]|uniref:Transcription factor protein n=1 Tax=Thecamonas trahens ATCC 50062 TaxID=461836 RepID=A0A0L0DB85_THETB|nr:transcription factor protein [Thecamonas trahens ATCC 50062]KNC49594.1 transcription factor protein [Thecamonas trahens ATCC 50062]|eukprot:XP_013757702.1 transcription factor protein [Thecamonas trahens ATCC 50062]
MLVVRQRRLQLQLMVLQLMGRLSPRAKPAAVAVVGVVVVVGPAVVAPVLRADAPAFVPGAVVATSATSQANAPTGGGGKKKQKRGKNRKGKGRAPEAGKGGSSRGPPPSKARPSVAPAPVDTVGHSTLAAGLMRELVSGSYECMVCMDNIKSHTAVWSCDRCFALFHIFCIKKWARAAEAGEPWRCPGCQHEVHSRAFKYMCYCGKVKEPEFNPYITPHSCGDNCGKLRKGTPCPHPCTMPCHPGPCPPCSATAPARPCFCGATTYVPRCSDVDAGRSCGAACGKPLNCGRHTCANECHDLGCPPCDIEFEQTCYCGSETRVRNCALAEYDIGFADDRAFACGSTCGKSLECGEHTCGRSCHKGPCGPCPLEPEVVTTCHCGNSELATLPAPAREACTDPISSCGGLCGRELECGQHPCPRVCHPGPCPPCTAAVEASCRCGSTSASALCGVVNADSTRRAANAACALPEVRDSNGDLLAAYQPHYEPLDTTPIRCKKVCTARLHCKRHRCREVCCPLNPDLPAAFGRDDPGGLHICRRVCNRELSCGNHRCERLCHRNACGECGNVSFDEMVCPCGASRILPPIECGTAPPQCSQPCSIPRPCGHPMAHPCHPAGSPCAPCAFLTSRPCNGGHKIMPHVRCSLSNVSCGAPCGVAMPCGEHTCRRTCHSGEHVVAKAAAGDGAGPSDAVPAEAADDPDAPNPQSCRQACHRMRSSCSHRCQAMCHPGEACPAVPCSARVRVSCGCGRMSREVVCSRGGPPETESRIVRALECDEECARVARNARLALALDSSGTAALPTAVEYSEFLQVAAVRESALIAMLEQTFGKLLATPSTTSTNLPPMPASQREVVHELAVVYHLHSESYDTEPHRRVVVSKRADSRSPPILLSEWQAVVRTTRKLEREKAAEARNLGVTLDPEEASVEDLNALQIYGLDPSVKTRNLLAFLMPFENEYRLQWVDDENALAIFVSHIRAMQAYNLLNGRRFPVRLVAVPTPSSRASARTSKLSGAAKRRKKLTSMSTTARPPPTSSAGVYENMVVQSEAIAPIAFNPFNVLTRTDLVREATEATFASPPNEPASNDDGDESWEDAAGPDDGESAESAPNTDH